VILIELERVKVGTLGIVLSLWSIIRGIVLLARLLDWDEESARGDGGGFDELGKVELLLANSPPSEGPVRKCVLDGEATLDLLLRW
jgi:hypothetical protein